MSLRLLVESAAGKGNTATYLAEHFDSAKKLLSHDNQTLLSSHSVTKEKISELLETGAHNYPSSTNYHQALAMSIIIGKILTLTKGKQK